MSEFVGSVSARVPTDNDTEHCAAAVPQGRGEAESFPHCPGVKNCSEKKLSRLVFLLLIMAALWNKAGHYIFVLWFLLSFFLPYSQPSQIGSLPYFHTWCGPSANLECRSEMCCTRPAGNTGRKIDAKNCRLRTIAQLCRAISSQLRHVSTIGKNFLSGNMSSTCPYNMVNFGPLAAEIISLVWGTPGNFNGFRVLAALLHGTLVVSVSQTLRR